MARPGAAQALTATQAGLHARAMQLLRGGAADEALNVARQLVAAAPQSADALQLLGMCLAQAGEASAAESAFRGALALAPGHPLILLNLAAALRLADRTPEALPILQQVVTIAPQQPKGWMDLGSAALAAGQPSLARQALTRATQLRPENPLVWHLLGNAQRATDTLEAAEAAFRRAIALKPDYASAWANLGGVLRLLGRVPEAIQCIERAGQAGLQGPESADALAGMLLDSGRPDAALAQARRVVQQYPHFAEGHSTLAHLLWEYGGTLAPGSDPLAAFRAAAQAYPQDRALRLQLVRFLLAARYTDEALAQIRDLRSQADDGVLIALEASALEVANRADLAAPLFEQAHRLLGATDVDFLNEYARHLLRSHRWPEAAAISEQATRLDPQSQQAWAYLSTAWRLTNDAREDWLCDYERLVSLVRVDVPSGFADMDAFLSALDSTLEPLHQAAREPVQQSLRGGSQTPGRLFGRADSTLNLARQSLLDAVAQWLAGLPTDAGHPFLRRKGSGMRIAGSWSVRLRSAGRHVNHIHPQGWISSAFYVALPPAVRGQSGAERQAGYIQFGQPPDELGLDLPPRKVIRPEPGHLALFPSYLWHGTLPFDDPQPRVTIAFDMTPISPPSAGTPA